MGRSLGTNGSEGRAGQHPAQVSPPSVTVCMTPSWSRRHGGATGNRYQAQRLYRLRRSTVGDTTRRGLVVGTTAPQILWSSWVKNLGPETGYTD
jgi:hypothetical protein